jgi:ribosomal protein S18 acetylase RimI-like enzyme
VRISNVTAIRLYEECGYRKIGKWEGYYSDREDGLVMEKGI